MPSVFAFAFSGIYAIVDGFFIGRKLGDFGLAAVNLAYPFAMLIQAVGTGIGMGGAIHLSISRGREDHEKEKRYLGNTCFWLLCSCLVITGGLLTVIPSALRLFGAQGEAFGYAVEYARVIVWGASFQILATGMIPIMRNLGKSFFAMICMVMGFVTNIVLDYVFIFVLSYGMAGAAWATVLGQAVTLIPCILLLLSKSYRPKWSDMVPRKAYLKNIAITGLSPFGLTISPFFVLIFMNRAAASYGGDLAVASYAVVSYVISVAQLLLQGVGDGSQPLMSEYFGRGDIHTAKQVCRMAYGTALVISILSAACVIAARKRIPLLFGTSIPTMASVSSILPIFAIAFLFPAVTRVTTAYFYSVGKNVLSYVLVCFEPVLLLICLLILPSFWNLMGVWIAFFLTQLILSAATVMLRIQYERSYR